MARLASAIVAVTLVLAIGLPGTQAQPPVTLTLGLGGEPDSLDYITAVGGAVARDIFSGLFEYLVDVNPVNGELRPGLATSWRLVDPTTYVFVLRRGVKFHNGEEFDAQGAKFTLDLVINAKSWLLSRIAFVQSVEVVDRYTLRIRSSQPDVLLPAGLGDIPMYPRQYYERVKSEGFSARPVGTGRYQFVRWERGLRVELERFEGYWGRKLPIQRLVFRPFVESATRIAALEAGEIDIANKVPPDDAERLRRRGFRIDWTPLGMGMVLVLNVRPESPLRDRRVRLALNYAIDKEALVKNTMLGFSKVLDGQLVGADGFGHNPELTAYPFDMQRARQLLAEAGFPNGFTIKMETSEGNYTKQREVSEALVGQLARVGVRVEMDVLEWATLVGKLIRTLDYAPLVYVGWQYFPAMDSDFVLRHYTSSSPFKLWSNPKFDELYRIQRAELDRTKRRAILRQAHAVLRDDAPMVFLFQAPHIYAMNSRVRFQPTPDERLHYETVVISR